MLTRIATGLTMAGLLTVGGAAASVAATAPTTTPAPTHHATCTRAPRALARIDHIDTRIATWLPKAQAREAAASKAGRTLVAQRIGRRVNRVERIRTRLTALDHRIMTRCPGSTPTSPGHPSAGSGISSTGSGTTAAGTGGTATA